MIATILFIFVALPALAAIGAMISVIQNANNRHEAANEREALARARRLEIEERRATREALREQTTAQAYNKTVIADLKIEREKAALQLSLLKIKKEMHELGLDAPTFSPTDYDSNREPVTTVTPKEFNPTNYD